MPKQQEVFSVNAKDTDEILATILQVFKTLNWDVLYAGETGLSANTVNKYHSPDRLIQVIYTTGSLEVSSETQKGESIDLMGKNKKNIGAFKTAYQQAEQTITPETIAAHFNELETVRMNTQQQVEKENADAAEIEEAMKTKSGNMYFTYGLIAVNTIIFILMAIQGAGVMEVNGLIHLKWGSNFAPLTLNGDWWRLFTCTFLHFGIIHLVMNMYALYSIGMYLEPMLGKAKYITAYVCTGILSSLASLWWHTEPANSAGASGAIFGMYGLFLAMLTTDLIPPSIRKTLLSNIAIFVGYNLIYGMKGGIDNSAHIGGLASGIVIGYLYVFAIKQARKDKNTNWALPAIVLLTIGGCAFYFSEHKGNPADKIAVEQELKDIGFYETDKFNDEFNQFVALQDEALVPIKNAVNYDEELKNNMDRITLPGWQKALELVNDMRTKNLSVSQKTKTDVMEKYTLQRISQAQQIKKLADESNAKNLATLDSLNDEISKTISQLKEN